MTRVGLALWTLACGACGRWGFEREGDDVPPGDAVSDAVADDARIVDDARPPADSPGDAMPDAPPVACQLNAEYVALGPFPSRYRSIASSASWMDAVRFCQGDGNAHLAVPDSAAEAMAVGDRGDWVGISDQAVEGTWTTILGDPASPLDFEPGQPDGGASEDCLRVFDSGTYEDRECGDTRDFVCECPVSSGLLP